MCIRDRFKQICEAKGTTPYKIAKKAGLSSSTVSCFLNGKTIPRIDTMMMLCNQLGVFITDFFDEREPVSYTHLDVYKRQDYNIK